MKMIKVTGIGIKRNIGKFDISDKARIMYAEGYIFDIIAHDTDTDAVYFFGFNYADDVLCSIEYIDGHCIEGVITPTRAIQRLSHMVQSGLFEFECRESDLVEIVGKEGTINDR